MDGFKDFWPLGKYAEFAEISQYDIAEFIFYAVFPLAVLIVWIMVSTQNLEKQYA